MIIDCADGEIWSVWNNTAVFFFPVSHCWGGTLTFPAVWVHLTLIYCPVIILPHPSWSFGSPAMPAPRPLEGPEWFHCPRDSFPKVHQQQNNSSHQGQTRPQITSPASRHKTRGADWGQSRTRAQQSAEQMKDRGNLSPENCRFGHRISWRSPRMLEGRVCSDEESADDSLATLVSFHPPEFMHIGPKPPEKSKSNQWFGRNPTSERNTQATPLNWAGFSVSCASSCVVNCDAHARTQDLQLTVWWYWC